MSTQLHKKRSFISTTDTTIVRYRNLNSITISYHYATVPFTLSFDSPPIPQKLWQEKRSNEKIKKKNHSFMCSAGVTSLLNNNNNKTCGFQHHMRIKVICQRHMYAKTCIQIHYGMGSYFQSNKISLGSYLQKEACAMGIIHYTDIPSGLTLSVGYSGVRFSRKSWT